MQLIQDLAAEHDLIERVVGSLRRFVEQRLNGSADPADGPRFVRFFRLFAGDYHHAREEDVLFVALREHAELPADRGPIKAITDDHHEMAGMLDEIAQLLETPLVVDLDRSRLEAVARDYSHALWHHIDAENSVLFPESQERLRRHGIRELPGRDMTPAEGAARADGEALVARYPPLDDPTVIRGEGCVFCRVFGDGCAGIEHEWWNDSEWDEFDARSQGL
jgi:hemerythrin-like domain-containing protein